MYKNTIFSRSCYYGDSEINTVKTEFENIMIHCSDDCGGVVVVLDKDDALELASAIIESYK